MKHAVIIIPIISLLLYNCNSKEKQEDNSIVTTEQPDVIPLPDSLIPESVRSLVNQLETNWVNTILISSSKWNLFGKQGIWLKTEKGIVDVVPFPSNIDGSMLKIKELKSESSTSFSYELRYKDTLEQIIQGKETFFVIGKEQIYKSLEKSLIEDIRRIEAAK